MKTIPQQQVLAPSGRAQARSRPGVRGGCAILTLALLTGSVRTAHADAILFFNPALFAGHETLVEFDGLGLLPSREFRSAGGVEFALLELGSLVDTGHGPSAAAAPNGTYSREFPPRDGRVFLNTITISKPLGSDLQLDFPQVVSRVAAEIRSGPASADVSDLTFELYRDAVLVAAMTVPIRGQDNFLFYGLSSNIGFDRWVIRQRLDPRFDLENLRFQVATAPEPGTLALLSLGLAGLGLSRRRIAA